MICPHCRQDEMYWTEVPCLDEDGDTLRFRICGNCGYGINEHTEGLCYCETIP